MRLYRTLLVSLMIAGLGVGLTWPQASSAASGVLTVCLGPVSGVRCDYLSISAAVAAASPGDTIEVIASSPIPPGLSYSSVGDVTITKALTLRAKGQDAVTLPGEVRIHGRFIIDAPGQTVTISGFSFLPDPTNSDLNNVGVRIKRGASQIVGNYFSGSKSPEEDFGGGSGVHIRPGEEIGTILIERNHFSNLGTAVIVIAIPTVIVKDNTFVDNALAIGISDSPFEIMNNSISRSGTGISVFTSKRGILAGRPGIIQKNSIIDSKEGVVIGAEKVRVLDNLIANGAVVGGHGINVFLGAEEVEISRNVITGNRGYGIVALLKPCTTGIEIEVKISGSDNLLAFNQQGNLCPADYPWPPGFVKP